MQSVLRTSGAQERSDETSMSQELEILDAIKRVVWIAGCGDDTVSIVIAAEIVHSLREAGYSIVPATVCPGCVNCEAGCDVWAGNHLWTELHDGNGTNWKQCEFCRERVYHE